MKHGVNSTPAILDFNDFEKVELVNNAGVRLTVRCTRTADQKIFYVKETYKDAWSASEVLAPQGIRLSGVAVPNNFLMINTEKHQVFKEHHEELRKLGKLPDQMPKFAVASEAIDKFQDVGQYLADTSQIVSMSRAVRHRLEEELKNHHVHKARHVSSHQQVVSLSQAARHRLEAELNNAPHLTPQQREKERNLENLKKSFSIQSEHDKSIIAELLPVAQWVGDWDFLNIKGYNAGYAQDAFGNLRPAKVDLGNCLDVGYQGNVKNKSLSKANDPALPDDPPLADKFKITQYDAEFKKCGTMRLLSSIPRRYAIEALFPELEKTIVDTLSDSKGAGRLSDGYAKGLYRLSLIADQAINSALSQRSLDKKGLTPFYPEAKAKELAETLISRRNDLVGARNDIGMAVRSWKNNPRNHVERLVIEREVQKAIYGKPQQAASI